MMVYAIQQPEVSSGLKRTYHKKLEVFECKANKEKSTEVFLIADIQAGYTYSAAKKQWIRKPIKHNGGVRCPRERIHTTSTTTASYYDKYVLFTTLEAAQVSKLLMIQQMAKKYNKELEELKALFKRNVPNVEEPMNQLLEEYPDLFI